MEIRQSNATTIEVEESEFANKRTDVNTSVRSLFSRKRFDTGEVIAKFSSRKTYPTPNYLTVQINEHEHVELMPEYLECINHSCDPNCFFDTTSWQLIALKAIEKGEELTFFYPSAEWEMDQAFQCHCGSLACIGMIQGAKYLSKGSVRKYRFTDFIMQKLNT